MRNRTLLFLFSFLVIVISMELNQHSRKVREIIAVWENEPPVFTTKAVVAKRSLATPPATEKPTTKTLPPTTKAIPARTILTTLTVAELPTQARTLRPATLAPTTKPVPPTPVRRTRSIHTMRRPASRPHASLPHWRKPKPFAKPPPKAAPRRPAPPRPIRPFPPAPVRPFRPRQPVDHGDHPPGIRPPKGIALTLNLAKLKDFKTVAFRLLHRKRIVHLHV